MKKHIPALQLWSIIVDFLGMNQVWMKSLVICRLGFQGVGELCKEFCKEWDWGWASHWTYYLPLLHNIQANTNYKNFH